MNAIIGHIVTEVSFYFCTPAEDGKTGFESVSNGGRTFRTNCDETITFVQFRCDEQADWSTVTDRNVTKYLVNAGFSNIDPCLVCYMSVSHCNGYSVCVVIHMSVVKVSITVCALAHICNVIEAGCYIWHGK